MNNNETYMKCKAEMSKLYKCIAIGLWLLAMALPIISIITTKAMNGLLCMIAVYIVFVLVTGFCDKYLKNKTKKMILPNNPCIKDVLFQIETMKCFYVRNGWLFKSRNRVNQEEYKARYLKYKGHRKHACNKFCPIDITDAIFYRFELINYYDSVILPSDIPEELKMEWKHTAIDNWVIIEEQ